MRFSVPYSVVIQEVYAKIQLCNDRHDRWLEKPNQDTLIGYLEALELLEHRLEVAVGVIGASSSGESSRVVPQQGCPQEIPPEYRTKPMSYREAGGYLLGKKTRAGRKAAGEEVSRRVKEGKLSRQPVSARKHIFDIREFPPTVHGSIRPS